MMELVEKLCIGAVVLDVGCGCGASTRRILEICEGVSYVVGIDIDADRLAIARNVLRDDPRTDLVCATASKLPFRDRCVNVAFMINVLHELDQRLVDEALREVGRILVSTGHLIVVDRVRSSDASESERLTIVAEDLRHRILELVKGLRAWSVRRADEYLEKLREHGFEPIHLEVRAAGQRLSYEEFLRRWVGKTLELLNEVRDPCEKAKLLATLEDLIEKVRLYGYGPKKSLVAILQIRSEQRRRF